MNTWRSNALTKTPHGLWRRFQHWRAMRMYARVVWHRREAERLLARANRLIGRNVEPPMPLFDREGR